jgi:siroheme synthase (precorrin-2 oxidase/ferrochelatase)
VSDDIDENVRKFYAQHVASGGVVLVIITIESSDNPHISIFSTFEKAHAWVMRAPNHSCTVMVPQWIDDPQLLKEHVH